MRVWRADTGEEVAAPAAPAGYNIRLALRPGGAAVALAVEGRVLVWELAAPRAPAADFDAHGRLVSALAFAPDGRRLAWLPDGARLATCGEDRSDRLRDARTGQEALALRTAGDLLTCLTWDRAGRRLAAGDRSGAAVVWRE